MQTQVITADFPEVKPLDSNDEALEMLEILVNLTDKTQLIVVKC